MAFPLRSIAKLPATPWRPWRSRLTPPRRSSNSTLDPGPRSKAPFPSPQAGGPLMGKWIVTSAWPYSSDVPHLGNLIGSVLSADMFARYLRMNGHSVVFVSGSDEHGTPVEIEAVR